MPDSELTDEEILVRIADLLKPDKTATSGYQFYFEKLFNRYYGKSIGFARYYGLSRDDALDAVQDAFAKIYRYIDKVCKTTAFKPYYFTVLMNVIRNKYKERNKHKTANIDDVSEAEIHSSVPSENIYDKLHNEDYAYGLIHRLPTKLREVMLLKIRANLDPPEIAAAAGIAVRQVYNRLDKALELIRGYMEAGYER